MTTIFTIGYEGATLSDFIATLKAAGVDRVIDVRELPQSRRAGFSKKSLSLALEDAQIGYEHHKQLGDPKAGRDAAKAGRYDEFRRIFTAHMETTASRNALDALAPTLKQYRCVLLCYERDHRTCHRNLLCSDLQKLGFTQVKHLGVQPEARSGRIAEHGTKQHARPC